MNKKLKIGFGLLLLGLLVLVMSSLVSSASPVLIDNLGDLKHNGAFRFKQQQLQTSQRFYDMIYKDGFYYISYLKLVSGYLQQHIANSSDLENWTITQMTSDSSNKTICHFYRDVDNDIICLWKASNVKLRYWHMGDEEDDWSSSYTEFDQSATYDYHISSYQVVQEIGEYIFFNFQNSSSFENYITFQMNFDDGSYDILFVGGSGSDLNPYQNVTTLTGYASDMIAIESDFDKFFRIFGADDIEAVYYSSPTYKKYNVSNTTGNGFTWLYYSESGDIYIFYIETTPNPYDMYYIVWDSATELFSSPTAVSLNNDTQLALWVDMVEGSDNLWGFYKTRPDGANDVYLKRFKINKSNMLLDQDIVVTSFSNVSATGNIYGLKNGLQRSSKVLVGNYLISPFVTAENSETNPNDVYPKDLWIYYEDVNDAFENLTQDVDLDCVYNYDCYAKFDLTYTCINQTCMQLLEQDVNLTSGDIAYDFSSWLGTVGIQSVSSKIFMGLGIIILLNMLVLVVFLSFHSEPNMIVHGIVSIVSLFALAYMGLFPIWIIVLLIIIGAGILFMLMKNG